MLLSDVRADLDRCTNKENNERRFQKLTDIPPQSRDLLENGNGGWQFYGACGSVSWQIKEPNGSRYLVEAGKWALTGLRVGLTWSLPWTSSVSACRGRQNEITVRTFNNEAGILQSSSTATVRLIFYT